jgi:hypothetical protein
MPESKAEAGNGMTTRREERSTSCAVAACALKRTRNEEKSSEANEASVCGFRIRAGGG